MVIDDKLANPQATENIYTVKKAYEHLLTADSTHFNREVLRQCALNEYITPNLTFDEERTQAAKEEILNNYSWANGLVVSGQKIIDRGEIVSPHTYNHALSRFIPERLLSTERQSVVTIHPDCVLQRHNGFHGDT